MHRLPDMAGGGSRLHDHDHPHGHDRPMHNHAGEGALHSHLRGGRVAARDELQALAESFIDGFRAAEDKVSYLRLAGVPFGMPGPDGLDRKLVDVTIAEGFQVATASPAFGSRDLVYLPFPGEMVAARTALTLVYVSLTGRTDLDLIDHLSARFAEGAAGAE